MTIEERVIEIIASSLSDNDVRPRAKEIMSLIGQARQEERAKVLNEIQARTVSVANLIKKAKAETDAISYAQGVLDGEKKVAREIQAWGDEICEEHFRYNNNMYVMRKHCLKCWQSLKSKYMEGK